MWAEAVKLAQMHLPHRVGEVSAAYQSSQARAGKGAPKGDYMSNGRSLEQSNQWVQAIDCYLGAKKERVDNIQDLEDIWARAIEVAGNHVPNRQVEVSLEVSRRLVEVKREENAADVLFEIGRHEEAVAVCLAAKKYDKAKTLAQGNPTLRRKVEDAYQGHLVVNEDHG